MNKFLKIDYYKSKLNSKDKKEFLVDSAAALGIRIGAAISAFLMNMVVARQTGLFYAGNFFLCFTIITVLATIVRMGGDYLLLRYVGIYSSENKWKSVRLVVSRIGKHALIFSVIITAVLIYFNPLIAKYVFHKEEIVGTLFWMLLSAPLLALCTLYAFGFQGLKRVVISVSIQSIVVPVVFCILTLIFKPHNSVDIAKLYFAASVFTLIFTLYLWYTTVPEGSREEHAILPDDFWKSNYAIWSFAILQLAMQWGGQFIAGIYCPQTQLAQLAVAQRTSMLIAFILMAINRISAPKFASLYKQGKADALKRYVVNSTRLLVLLSTPGVIIILCFPAFVMSLFGPGFAAGASMLFVLALGQYINVLTGTTTMLLIMTGHERDMRNLQFFTGVFSVILNLVLIQKYGALGAAVATAISMAAQNLVCVGIIKRRLGFNTLNIWSKL
jgi:O-antigen/teichoic acid export membrane protein